MLRALIVDDNEGSITSFRYLVQNAGLDNTLMVDTASTVEEGYGKLQSKCYDYLFIDVTMGEITERPFVGLGISARDLGQPLGLRLAEKAKEVTDATLIAITANTLDKAHGRELFNYILEKPFRGKQETLKQIINRETDEERNARLIKEIESERK